MQSLQERLRSNKILIFDGAMGSELYARDFTNLQCLDFLNLERPDIIEEISSAYRDAGADVLQTNTFGASPLRLRRHGLADQMAEINRRGVELARKSAGGHCFVVASCGPCGLRIPEDVSAEEVYRSFSQQMKALADADAILVETMLDLREALLAVEAAFAVLPGKPVLVTLTFDANGRTQSGITVREVVAKLEAAGATAVGANCGTGAQSMIGLAREIVAAARVPVLMQPSAGLPHNDGGRWIYPESPEIFAGAAGQMLEAGARFLGGCCGATPAHIRALKELKTAFLIPKERA